MSPNDFNAISDDPHGGSSSLVSTDSCSYNIESDPSVLDMDRDPVPPSPHLNFSRLAYNMPQFNEEFEAIDNKSFTTARKIISAVKPKCSHEAFKRNVKSLFPITEWLGNYHWKHDFVADLIAGITIAVFQVPQSMGYSLLSKVPPVFGLYSSFFPALIYAIMGSSRHSAVGTFAVVSLMTGTLISQIQEEMGLTSSFEIYNESLNAMNESTKGTDSPEHELILLQSASKIAIVITLLIGIYQLLFGILRLGFVSVYMSEQLISSFVTASSFYVLTSQMGYLFGVKLKYRSGPLSLFYTYADLFSKITRINPITVSISGCCIILLLFFKLYFNDKIKQWTRINIPFPIELVIVIVGTYLSSFFDLNGYKNVAIVGTIPTGIPVPKQPEWSLIGRLWIRCIPLSVVGYAITYSTGKTFAAKHKYNIDSNQELLAIGTVNSIGCFFSCIPSAASLSRSAVQESAGGRTQMVSLVNCFGLLAVLLYFGAFLEKLPNCILASVIAVALKSLFSQMCIVTQYCKVNKVDGSIWIVTFLAVILLDVDHGLYVGLTYSLLTLIYKSQRPKTYLLGSIHHTDVYVPVKKYLSANEIKGIKIYQFCGPLHFANVEYFKKELIIRTDVSVNEIIAHQRKLQKLQNRRNKYCETDRETGCGTFRRMKPCYRDSLNPSLDGYDELPTHIIIDCSMFSYIDTAGVNTLKTTIQEYESIGIKTYLASCATHVMRMMEKDHFYEEVPPHHVYITIHDAVHHAKDDQKNNQLLRTVDCHDHIEVNDNNNDLKSMEPVNTVNGQTPHDGGDDSPEMR